MSKRNMSREQEKAMFAQMNTSKSYSTDYAERQQWEKTGEDSWRIPETEDTVTVLRRADGREYKISINHDLNAGEEYGCKDHYWRKSDAVTDANRLIGRYPEGFDKPPVQLGTQPQPQKKRETAVKKHAKAKSDAPKRNTISKTLPHPTHMYVDVNKNADGEYEVKTKGDDEIPPIKFTKQFTSKKRAIRWARKNGYHYSKRWGHRSVHQK